MGASSHTGHRTGSIRFEQEDVSEICLIAPTLARPSRGCPWFARFGQHSVLDLIRRLNGGEAFEDIYRYGGSSKVHMSGPG